MNRRKKVGIAALIVAVGAGLAWQFRHAGQPLDEATNSGGNFASHSGVLADNRGNTTPVAQGSPSFAGRVENTFGSLVTAEADDAPPPLPRGIDLFRPSSGAPLGDRATGQAPVSVMAVGELVSLDETPRTHVVSDGDTLPALAARYLNAPSRAIEIFELNRDYLRDPELLPLGVELRIPPKIPPVRPPVQAEPQPLEPLPPLPAVTPPGGTPAKPASATQPKKEPRTYTVVEGDNLVDLARKFYGDGRRHEQLFEANRDVLKNPARLKAGTVLKVP